MERENQFWIQSHLPTGYGFQRPKYVRQKVIPESEYDTVKGMRSEGKSPKDIAIKYCCSTHSVNKVLKAIGT